MGCLGGSVLTVDMAGVLKKIRVTSDALFLYFQLASMAPYPTHNWVVGIQTGPGTIWSLRYVPNGTYLLLLPPLPY